MNGADEVVGEGASSLEGKEQEAEKPHAKISRLRMEHEFFAKALGCDR